jgi:hypothetical protein
VILGRDHIFRQDPPGRLVKRDVLRSSTAGVREHDPTRLVGMHQPVQIYRRHERSLPIRKLASIRVETVKS